MTLPDARDLLDEPSFKDQLGRLALFLDFDGTLAPIVDRPGDAAPLPAAKEAVAALASRVPVAVISGRDLDDVRARLGVEGLAGAGSHGYDLLGFDGEREEIGAEFLPDLERFAAEASSRLDPGEGFEVERKARAVAVHYRRAGEDGKDRAADAVEAAWSYTPKLVVKPGKMIFEARPDFDWHKGRAVEKLLKSLSERRPFPLYIGDDTTDEDAIRAVQAKNVGGLGVIVGDVEFKTKAQAALPDVEAVADFLGRLVSALRAER